jgi:7-carboxy-7-deazaguanine synthase
MSISPKRENSTPQDRIWKTRHEDLRDRPQIVAQMTRDYRYQLKYVIDTPGDIDDVDRHVRAIGGVAPSRVFLMPQGTQAEVIREKTSWLSLAASQRGYRVSPRLHIELFGNRRGT